jgi:hypothetical protein
VFDVVFYDASCDVSVVSPGSEYDISNPPILSVTDGVGTGCSAFCEVDGNISEIEVLDGGFDYITTPPSKTSISLILPSTSQKAEHPVPTPSVTESMGGFDISYSDPGLTTDTSSKGP